MIKLRVPSHLSSVSHEGHSIEIQGDDDRFVMVDARHAPDLAVHGLTAWDAAAPAGTEKQMDARRASLFARLAEMATGDLEALLELTEGSKAGVGDDVDAMDKAQLFALLKAKGVSAGPATSVEKLRDIAREHAKD